MCDDEFIESLGSVSVFRRTSDVHLIENLWPRDACIPLHDATLQSRGQQIGQ